MLLLEPDKYRYFLRRTKSKNLSDQSPLRKMAIKAVRVILNLTVNIFEAIVWNTTENF